MKAPSGNEAYVRETLPDVRLVDSCGTVHTCRTSGRLEAFATVYDPVSSQSWEFSWATVTRAFINHTVLHV